MPGTPARIGDSPLDRRIADVLAQRSSYDALPEAGQAIVRTVWAERIERGCAELDIPGEFAAIGRDWVELAEDGSVVVRSGTLK